MKNIPKVVYLLCTVLVLTMILTFASDNQVNESVLRGDASFQILSDYEVNAYKNEDAPIGITQIYKCSLHDIPAYNGCVTFYIVHQEVDAYLDDELVYQFKLTDDATMSKSPGYDWAEIYVDPADEGKELTIYVHPSYETSLANSLQIYLATSMQSVIILWFRTCRLS